MVSKQMRYISWFCDEPRPSAPPVFPPVCSALVSAEADGESASLLLYTRISILQALEIVQPHARAHCVVATRAP